MGEAKRPTQSQELPGAAEIMLTRVTSQFAAVMWPHCVAGLLWVHWLMPTKQTSGDVQGYIVFMGCLGNQTMETSRMKTSTSYPLCLW